LVNKVRTYSTDPQLVIERRKLITERSLKIFLEKGFEKSTLRDLGAACNMTPGALYHYIGSKEDILRLISSKYSLNASVIKKQLARLGNTSRKKALLECFTLFCQQQEFVKDYNILFERMGHHFSPHDRQIMGKYKLAVKDLFEGLIAEGIETGEFHAKKTRLVVYNMLMYGYNWSNRSWFLTDHYTLEEYVNEQFRALFEPSMVETGKYVEQEYSPARQTAEATERDI